MAATGGDEALVAKFAVVLPHLDERQRRLLLGAEAISLGRGGITAVAIAAGVSRPMVTRGVAEVRNGAGADGRVRRPGGGRKPLTETDPGLPAALEALVDPITRGDPMSPLRWTTKSTRNLADALTGDGHPVSHVRVGELLHSLGYSLQGNAKAVEGKQHPDRDGQFAHINTLAKRYLKSHDPVISIDAKKKELVRESPGYKNHGRDWQPQGEPVRVGTHDFPDPKIPKAVPYGIYDLAANTGWVTVGSDGDTGAFAVAADGDPAGVGGQVVDAVGDGLGDLGVGEVVGPDANRLALGLPVAPVVLVARGFSDEFLLLGVNADHRIVRLQVPLGEGVDVRELPVAVRVLLALDGLGVALQAVAQAVQQLAHAHVADRMPVAGQGIGEVPRRLGRPPQRRHRVPSRDRVDQSLQRCRQPGVGFGQGLAPAPGPADPTVCLLYT